MLFSLGILLAVGCSSPPAIAVDKDTRVETGRVNWLRNLDEAKKLSASTDKPILLLFQEIPG